MAKIEVGQWWESRDGDRMLIIAILSGINGVVRLSSPVVAVDRFGDTRHYYPDGRYKAKEPHDSDLYKLLASECDGFEWGLDKQPPCDNCPFLS